MDAGKTRGLRWDLRDIKGTFRKYCEWIEQGWQWIDKAPEGYEPGETMLLVYLEENARKASGTAFKSEHRGKWFDPPEEGKWKYLPTEELCKLSVDEVIDLLDEKWICQTIGCDHERVIQARKDSLDFDKLRDKATEQKSVRVDADITPELFIAGKGIRKVEDTPLSDDKHFVKYEKEKGHTKILVQGVLPFEREPVFSRNTFETYKTIALYAMAEKTLNPILLKRDIARFIGADTSPNLYARIPDYIEFLVNMSYQRTDTEKKTREWGHLINYAKEFNTDPKAKNGYFYFELNPHHHKYLTAHIQNPDKLPRNLRYNQLMDADTSRKGSLKAKYLSITRDLSIKRTHKAFIKSLLREDIGLTENELNKRSMDYTARLLDEAIDEMNADWFPVIAQESLDALKTKNPYFTAPEGFPPVISLVNEIKRANLERKEAGGSKGNALTRKDYLQVKLFLERVGANGSRNAPKYDPNAGRKGLVEKIQKSVKDSLDPLKKR